MKCNGKGFLVRNNGKYDLCDLGKSDKEADVLCIQNGGMIPVAMNFNRFIEIYEGIQKEGEEKYLMGLSEKNGNMHFGFVKKYQLDI